MTNMNDDVLTVGDLRALLDRLPDEEVVWVFNNTRGTFTPVFNATHDKRVGCVNLWVED